MCPGHAGTSPAVAVWGGGRGRERGEGGGRREGEGGREREGEGWVVYQYRLQISSDRDVKMITVAIKLHLGFPNR